MGIFSYLKDKVVDFLNPVAIYPPRVKKFGETLFSLGREIGLKILGKGNKSVANTKVSDVAPQSKDTTKPRVIRGDDKKTPLKKRGIIHEAVELTKTAVPILAGGVTLGYAAEKVMEFAGVRGGAGLIGARPDEMQVIGNGKKAPVCKPKKKVRVKPRKKKKVKRKPKRRPKKGRRVTFITKKGKRVSFIVKPKVRKAKRRTIKYRAKTRKHQIRPKGVSKTELKRLKRLIRKFEKD